MSIVPPVSKVSAQIVPVYGVSAVSSDSLFLSSSFYILFPVLEEHTVVEESPSHFSESLKRTYILILSLFHIKALLLFLIDGSQKFINISLLFVHIVLIVVLIVDDVLLLHELVLFKKFSLETGKQSIVDLFETLDVLAVVRERNLFSNDREMGACCNT